MCGTSRDSAHKIHTQHSTSTRGMFPAHFTIRAEPGRATPRLLFDVCAGERKRKRSDNSRAKTDSSHCELGLAPTPPLEINYQCNHGGEIHPCIAPQGALEPLTTPPRSFGARRGAWHAPGSETLPCQAGNAVGLWGDWQRDKGVEERLHRFGAHWVREPHY